MTYLLAQGSQKMDGKPFVSIIMVNFNGKADLANCLPSLFNTDYPSFEVIIVDNRSTDGSLQTLQELSKREPRLKIVRNSRNLGFAQANNIALKYAKGDLIVLLNCDTIVSPLWLERLVETITESNDIGIVQSKLRSLYNPKIIDSAGDLLHPSGFSIPQGMGEKDSGQYDNLREIFSARGAAMMIRRNVIEEIGFFDPDYFMSYEDIDLSWRARLAGYRVRLAPTSIVYHRGFDLCKDTYLVKIYHTYKNMYMTVLKNYETGNLLRFMPQLIAMNFVKILSFLIMQEDLIKSTPFTFKLKAMLTLIKAPLYVLRNFPTIWKKRMQVQCKRRVPDNVVMSAMSRLTLSAFILNIRAAKQRIYREYIQRQCAGILWERMSAHTLV